MKQITAIVAMAAIVGCKDQACRDRVEEVDRWRAKQENSLADRIFRLEHPPSQMSLRDSLEMRQYRMRRQLDSLDAYMCQLEKQLAVAREHCK